MDHPEYFIGKTIQDVPTPAFLVNKEKVERNCRRMLTKCESLGISLRPHTKTHKTIEGAIIQTGGRKRSLTVSTLQEATFYANNGFDDILYAFPLAPHHLKAVYQLSERLQQFHVMVNNGQAVDMLLEFQPPPNKVWSVFLKVDTGYHRAGIPWSSTEFISSLAKKLHYTPTTKFMGLYSHCGNSYSTDREMVIDTRDKSVSRMITLRNELLAAGLPCPNVAVGSTPSCSLDTNDDMKLLTEFHPGNYVFYDAQQESYGSCSFDDIAVQVMTRVLSHHPERNQILVDLGFTGLTKQGQNLLKNPGYGVVKAPNLQLIQMSQELGIIGTIDSSPLDMEKYPIGKELFLFPYHSCATAAMYQHYFVHNNEGIITEIWKPTRGW